MIEHKTLKLQIENSIIDVDEKLYNIIAYLSSLDIKTLGCCQKSPSYKLSYIEFNDCNDLSKFVNILLKHNYSKNKILNWKKMITEMIINDVWVYTPLIRFDPKEIPFIEHILYTALIKLKEVKK